MKLTQTILALLLALFICQPSAISEEGPIKGPNKGRIIKLESHHVEWRIRDDGRIEVRFFDKQMKPKSLTDATVQSIAQAPGGTSKFDLTRQDGVYRSEKPFPEGDGYTVVVRIRNAPEARFTNIRFVYESHICGGCDLPEYACFCVGH